MKASLVLFLVLAPLLVAGEEAFKLRVRASEIDPRVKSHPEIGFVLADKKGKPQDEQNASVDLSVPARGRLAIWLMAPNEGLFERLNSYGIHAIQVHYARQWFSRCCQQRPVSATCRGNLRLEAATGEDHSEEAEIPPPDSIKGRALQFIRHLAQKHPEGNWAQFLTPEQDDLVWEKVILCGSSHGSTTAARLAKHTRVARVVALCGPRDQYQSWQALPSATPENRFFAFSHLEDLGWQGFHYQRSWDLLGLPRFGPIVDVEQSEPPYQNTRRLVTSFEVGGDARRAHSAVTPGRASARTENGALRHDPVWEYLFTHPVEQVGEPVPPTGAADKIAPQKSK